eukprot:TRINITY_DN28500_c0_g1_i1.p1 TRINITY_DN28500_c0_g1~~TRINITY_DN28500_c0_g1_i1.p1  ORF type:complete len:435 (+),score=73.61 TRINITY_DN28500_c0_g1_i1:60-1364(+)
MDQYAAAAAQAVAEVVLVSSAGAYMVFRGALPKTALKTCDKMLVEVFTPSLVVAKVVPHANIDGLIALWPLMIACVWDILLGLILGWGVSACLRKPSLRGIIQAAISFPNAIAVCLTLAQALARTPALQGIVTRQVEANTSAPLYAALPRDDVAAVLSEQAGALILTSTVWWNLSRWTVGYSLVAPPNSSQSVASRMRKVINPPVLACVVAIAIGVSPARTWWLSEDPAAQVLVSAVTMLGRCMVPTVMLLLGARVAHSVVDMRRAKADLPTAGGATAQLLTPPPRSEKDDDSVLSALAATSTSTLDHPLRTPTDVVPSAFVSFEPDDAPVRRAEAYDWKVVCAVILCRQCVCAVSGLALVYALSYATRDAMLLVCVYLQTAGPPAINLTVMAGLHGSHEEAMARTLMYAYLGSVATWTGAIALLLQVLEACLL